MKIRTPYLYGAMISEGIVAMIWATAAMAYFGGAEGLNAAATAGKKHPLLSWMHLQFVVRTFWRDCRYYRVVVCPITSGRHGIP